MSLTYEELECRLMKAEYDLAEMEKFTDGLIQQKVQAERERVIKEIENWLESLKPKCPFCGSNNVILFTSDDDMCKDCNKSFSGVISGKNELTEKLLKSKLKQLKQTK